MGSYIYDVPNHRSLFFHFVNFKHSQSNATPEFRYNNSALGLRTFSHCNAQLS